MAAAKTRTACNSGLLSQAPNPAPVNAEPGRARGTWTDALDVARRILTQRPDLTWPTLWPLLLAAEVAAEDQEDACRSALRRAAAKGQLPTVRADKRGPKTGTEWSQQRRDAMAWQKPTPRPIVDEPTVYELQSERRQACLAMLSTLVGVIAVELSPRTLAILAAQGYGSDVVMDATDRLVDAGLAEVRWQAHGCDLWPRVEAA
ncbi:hypothetical protein [Capillimicrobium parvum]|uniref:Uncharacterized protein n=1 Tax=Capillimicrobium parvum TaxID=2884022 RepID=A0A9E7C161_9ACTN|nr:hypothetical protein [Capillimicrobium parvum]UGS36103.1 hypothetical protein DSM104329_02501 [Capillimicrobium parvum]